MTTNESQDFGPKGGILVRIGPVGGSVCEVPGVTVNDTLPSPIFFFFLFCLFSGYHG